GIETKLEYSYVPDELAQGVPEKEARSGPIGLGYRVPMILCSPWSRGGWVNSQLFEHTSTLQFLERFVEGKYNKRIRESNISEWRRAISGDLSSAFRQYDGKRPSLPFLNRDQYVESIQRARYKEVPSDYKALTAEQIASVNHDARRSGLIPAQEPGVRRACALPYEPYADGHLDRHGKKFELEMRAGNRFFGERAAGFPFNVYLYGTRETTASTAPSQSRPNMISATYAVKAGGALRESTKLSEFAGDRYDIAIHGPNGFFRKFTGDHNDPAIEVTCSYHADGRKLSSDIVLEITHKGGSQPYTIQITDNSYHAQPVIRTIAPGTANDGTILDLSHQHGWYDFSVKVAGANGFEKRYAGHAESGSPSYTDPLMGEV
ncbi:MAG: phospholipase domain-containing protein, partial [Acidobacteriaceae bacterium]